MNCLFLFSNIDWTATGAMICGVGSVISTITLVLGIFISPESFVKSKMLILRKNTEFNCLINTMKFILFSHSSNDRVTC